MPTNADNSPNIKWPLPAGSEAFNVSSLLAPEILDEIKLTIKEKALWGPENLDNANAPKYHTVAGRWVTEIEFSKNVWNHIEEKGREHWGRQDLRLKTLWMSRYQQHDGIVPYLWEHMDQSAAQYVIDICIEEHIISNWGVEIDGYLFNEQANSGIFFMAQQQIHSRPKYPIDNPEAYLVVLFANFATPDHWVYNIDCYSPEGYKEFDEKMEITRLDSEIRFYELKGYPSYFNDFPETNRICEGCQTCWVVDPGFISKIPNYIKKDTI